MNKVLKNLSVVLLAVLCLLTLAGCNKVKEKNYNKIEEGMTKANVIEVLGDFDASTNDNGYVTCYWFKGVDTYQEALDKVNAGKDVLTITVVFQDNKVVSKTMGNYVIK